MDYKKTFQYRLKPNEEQLVQIEQAAGAVRFVYNWGTDLVRKASEKREPIPNYYVLAKCLTHLKREADKTWLKQSYNATLQNSLKDLDLSVKAFFREIKKKNRVGLPGFRRKGFNESIRFSSGIKHTPSLKSFGGTSSSRRSLGGGGFYLPKIGLVDYCNSRPLEGKIKQAVVCKIVDKWFINIICDVPIREHANVFSCANNPKTNANSLSIQQVANLVLSNAKPQEDATINNAKSLVSATKIGCTISLGDGFLDRVLKVDATLDKPNPKKRKKSKNKKAKGYIIGNDQNNATTICIENKENSAANRLPINENQVSEMTKETRNSLRALCKHYSDIFVSTADEKPMDHQMPKNIINSLPNKASSKKANRLLVRRQKKLSRSERNSKNREKARIVLEKQHLKIRRRRHDFLHKISHKIVQKYDSITIKKYDLKRIMLCAYTPLAKVLREKAWDKFIQYIKYKSAWYGKKFVLT